jgi:hypothetical protein
LIEETIKFIENILGRKLTGQELIAVGIAYQSGYAHGLKQGGRTDDGKK